MRPCPAIVADVPVIGSGYSQKPPRPYGTRLAYETVATRGPIAAFAVLLGHFYHMFAAGASDGYDCSYASLVHHVRF